MLFFYKKIVEAFIAPTNIIEPDCQKERPHDNQKLWIKKCCGKVGKSCTHYKNMKLPKNE